MSSMHVGMELEHATGFAGSIFDGVHQLPDSDTYIYAAGACVVLAKVSDPHSQMFLRGHDAPITCLQLSKSGRLLATAQGGENADVIVWDLSSNQILYRFQEHDHGIEDIAFSDDERLLVSVGIAKDGRLYVWDLATGCINAHTTLDPSPCLCVQFGGFVRDIKRRETGAYQFMTAGESAICLWALDPIQGTLSQTKIDKKTLGREIICAVFETGSNCDYLYCGTTSGEIVALNLRSHQTATSALLCSGGICSINAIESGIFVGGGDGQFIMLQGRGPSLVPQCKIQLDGSLRSLSSRPLNDMKQSNQPNQRNYSTQNPSSVQLQQVIVGSTNGIISCIRLNPKEPTNSSIQYGSAMSAAVPPNQDYYQNSTQHNGKNNTRMIHTKKAYQDPRVVILSEAHAIAGVSEGEGAGFIGGRGAASLSVDPGAGLKHLHHTKVIDVQFAYDSSEKFASAGTDNTIRVWNLNDYSSYIAALERNAGHPQCIDFSYELIVSGWQDGHVRCYLAEEESSMQQKNDLARQQTTHLQRGTTFQSTNKSQNLWTLMNAHKSGISALAVGRNQRFFMTGGNEGAIRLWDMRNRDMVSQLIHHSSSVTRMLLYQDDAHAITSGRDKSLVCWDLRAEERVSCHIQKMGAIHDVALSADESLVMTVGQDRKLSYWDLREREPVIVIPDAHNGNDIYTVATSHNGNFITTGGADGVIKLWDIRTAQTIQTGLGHSACVRRATFTNDDRQIVSAGDDGCILLWNVYT